tara:strand:+ start:79 stop:378 length:300 start_codon:yes stop_codon:yes gene_type:complete
MMNNSRKGDFAEFYAVTWLWDNGYEVFLNAGATGPMDMVAIKDGKVTLIDVKTLQPDYRWNDGTTSCRKTRTEKQKELGVVFVGFNPETRQLRWVDHKE